MKTDSTKRPFNDRGQGRKSLSGSGITPITAIRLTPEQKEKLVGLGGAEWIRKAIDSATDDQSVISTDKDKAVNQALHKVEQKINKLIENARAKA